MELDGSTKTAADTPTPPRRFPRELFMIGYDSGVHDGETNSQRRTEEANAAAADGNSVACNLNLKFLQVDGHDVQPTPSANLAVAANELARLPASPELAKATALLKAA